MRMAAWRPGLAAAFLVVLSTVPVAAGPADSLLRLVPPDAAATLTIEDLRGRSAELLASPVAQDWKHLPAYQSWLASDRYARFADARKKIESAFGVPLATLRDDLLGDAVVLVIRVPPHGRPDQARGLLLVRAANRPLLDRVVDAFNNAQTRSGNLARLNRVERAGVAYWEREFRPAAAKPAEYYTVLEDNTLAWANAEELIQGVIDRRGGQARSLFVEPRFQKIRGRLPQGAVASLFLDPRFLAQLLTPAPRAGKPAGDRAAQLLGRYLGAMEFLGASLQWHNGLVMHTEASLDPQKLDPWIRHWAARPAVVEGAARRAPADALALASAQFDWPAALEILRAIVPERALPKIDNLMTALSGIALGRDLQTDLLPRLSPGVLAYLEVEGAASDARSSTLSRVLVARLGQDAGVSAAVENALRTYLAVYALNDKHGGGQLRLESQDLGGVRITALRPATPLAFAIDHDRLFLGSSAAAVARAVTQAANPSESPLEQLRATRFPHATSFACVDLVRLLQYVDDHRAGLTARLAARPNVPRERAERDIDEATALLGLFSQAYTTSAIEPDASAVHRTFALVPRAPAAPR